MLTALLVGAVVSATMPGSTRAGGLQVNYGSASFNAGASPAAAKIGDLDGDGLNDIVVVNTDGSLQLFFNLGGASFERVSLGAQWPAANTLDVAIGDLNGDGRNDIAVAFSTSTGAVSVLLNQGARAFSAPVNYATCSYSSGVAIGDMDRDGDNDLADVSQCDSSSVLLNNGHGGFTLGGSYGSGFDSRSVTLADFNGDGFKDIAYVNKGINVDGSVTVLFNNGNGMFGGSMWLYAGDLPDDLTVGDFDGDGTTDIAIANSYYSQVLVLFNDRQGTFTTGYSELSAGDTPTSIACADFNGDGRLDYAVASRTTNSLSVFLNQGNYGFAAAGAFYILQSPVDLETGDLDGDSLPDLVAVNQGSGTITAFFSAGGSPPPPPPAPITLTLSTRTTSRAKLVDLRWNGATSSFVDIYRNGSRIATVANTGSYTDQLSRRAAGVFTYKVCVAGGQQCSNQSTISF